jgi:hypothetical protein
MIASGISKVQSILLNEANPVNNILSADYRREWLI